MGENLKASCCHLDGTVLLQPMAMLCDSELVRVKNRTRMGVQKEGAMPSSIFASRIAGLGLSRKCERPTALKVHFLFGTCTRLVCCLQHACLLRSTLLQLHPAEPHLVLCGAPSLPLWRRLCSTLAPVQADWQLQAELKSWHRSLQSADMRYNDSHLPPAEL